MAVKRTPMTPTGSANAGGMPAGKQKKPKKPRKPLPRFMLIVLTVFVMLLLLGGAGACLYFNVYGLADKAMVLFPQYRDSYGRLKAQETALATTQAELKAGQDKLTADQAELAKQNETLKKGQEKLAADKKAFQDSKKATPAPTSTATQGNSQQDVVAIYEALDASVAADMLVKAPTLREAADILSSLSVEKAAEIISAIKAIDAEKAYNLTKLIGQ